MRCPDCGKFVPYEDPHEVEIESDPDLVEGSITAAYRVLLKCGECGTELKDASLSITHEVPELQTEEHKDHELEWEVDDPEPDVRAAGRGRGTKTYYGLTAQYKVTCSCGGTFEGSFSEHEQANSMNDLA